MAKKSSILKVFQKRQHDKVLDQLRSALDDNPDDVKTRNHLGDYLLRAGQNEAAAAEYRKVAEFYSQDGFHNKAIAIYKKILSINPDDIELYINLADLYSKEKLLNEAFGQLSVVKNHYEKNKMFEEAIDILRKMVALNPHEYEVRAELIRYCFKVNLHNEAVDEFKKLVSQAKDEGRAEDLIKLSENILADDPQNAVINKELGKLHLMNETSKKSLSALIALSKFKKALGADPRDEEALRYLGRIYMDLKQMDNAESTSLRLNILDPDNRENLERLVKIYRAKGDTESYEKFSHKLRQLYENLEVPEPEQIFADLAAGAATELSTEPIDDDEIIGLDVEAVEDEFELEPEIDHIDIIDDLEGADDFIFGEAGSDDLEADEEIDAMDADAIDSVADELLSDEESDSLEDFPEIEEPSDFGSLDDLFSDAVVPDEEPALESDIEESLGEEEIPEAEAVIPSEEPELSEEEAQTATAQEDALDEVISDLSDLEDEGDIGDDLEQQMMTAAEEPTSETEVEIPDDFDVEDFGVDEDEELKDQFAEPETEASEVGLDEEEPDEEEPLDMGDLDYSDEKEPDREPDSEAPADISFELPEDEDMELEALAKEIDEALASKEATEDIEDEDATKIIQLEEESVDFDELDKEVQGAFTDEDLDLSAGEAADEDLAEEESVDFDDLDSLIKEAEESELELEGVEAETEVVEDIEPEAAEQEPLASTEDSLDLGDMSEEDFAGEETPEAEETLISGEVIEPLEADSDLDGLEADELADADFKEEADISAAEIAPEIPDEEPAAEPEALEDLPLEVEVEDVEELEFGEDLTVEEEDLLSAADETEEDMEVSDADAIDEDATLITGSSPPEGDMSLDELELDELEEAEPSPDEFVTGDESEAPAAKAQPEEELSFEDMDLPDLDEEDELALEELPESFPEDAETETQKPPETPADISDHVSDLDSLFGGGDMETDKADDVKGDFDLAKELGDGFSFGEGDGELKLSSSSEGLEADEVSEAESGEYEYGFASAVKEVGKIVDNDDQPWVDDSVTHFNLGKAYLEAELYDMAIDEFRRATSDSLREADARLMIGVIHLKKADFKEAVAEFKQGLNLKGLAVEKAINLYYNLGQAYEKLGQKDEALKCYKEVFRFDTNFEDVADRIKQLS